MHRKTIAIYAALVAFGALVIAPAASSAHVLEDTNGAATTTVANNALIVGYNESTAEPTILTAAGLEVKCQEATVTGSVHTNGVSDEIVRGTITHAWFEGTEAETECTSGLGRVKVTIPQLTQKEPNGTSGKEHWCIETAKGTDNAKVSPAGCTESDVGKKFTFILDITGGITCGFQREKTINMDFKTNAATHKAVTVTLTEEPEFTTDTVASHSIFCPASGKLKQFNFELFTDKDTTTPHTWRHAASVANPVWIK